MPINNFLQRLIVDCKIKKEIIFEIIASSKQEQLSFISYLIHTKKIDSSYLARLLAEEFLLTYIDLDTVDVLQIPINLINEKLLQTYQCLPLWRDKEKLGLALIDPSQQAALEDIRFSTGLMLECMVVDEKKLIYLLQKIRKRTSIKPEINELDLNKCAELKLKEINSLNTSLNTMTTDDDLTIINYVYRLLLYAITHNASDVHIEPYQEQLEIRFRIDGLLYSIVVLPKYLIPRIITRLKIMSQLDIAERRIPQDGRFQVKDSVGRNVDCRGLIFLESN